MKKMKLVITLSFLIASQLHGQNSALEKSILIDKICTDYDSLIQQSIEEEMDFYPAHITIKSTLSKRAIGEVDHTIKLYFDEHEEFEEPVDEEEYYMPLKYAIIRKAIVILESGSYLIESNFYFDEDGYLVKFYFSENGYECYEETSYFDQHKPIRITHKEIETELCSDYDDPVEPYDKTNLNDTEKASALLLVKQAEKYRQILTNQYDIIKD